MLRYNFNMRGKKANASSKGVLNYVYRHIHRHCAGK